MFAEFFLSAFPEPVRAGLGLFFSLAPIWLPIFLAVAFSRLWLTYVRAKFESEQEHVLLEIKLPRYNDKSPIAMEAIFSMLHSKSGESTFIDRWILGKSRAYFSVELVSTEGQVHFYIWTRTTFRRLITSSFYAYYPDIEVIEVPDYTRQIQFDMNEYGIFGGHFMLTQPDPVPIKTYIDYGLDRSAEDTERVDPLASMLEYLGSAGPGEHIWYQIIIRHNRAEKRVKGGVRLRDWKQEAKDYARSIYDDPEMIEVKNDGEVTKKLSKTQTDLIDAVYRSIAKQGFDAGYRGFYLAKREIFSREMTQGVFQTLKAFNSERFNNFAPQNFSYKLDYPWEDFRNMRQRSLDYRLFDAFRRRSWFFSPYRYKYYVLNTEELATLWHIPGSDVRTPNLQRVPSARAEAPSNLPT